MARQHPEVAQEVKPRRRYRGNEPEHQIFWRKHDGARAVLPNAFQRELERAVRAHAKPVLRYRRARDVPGKPLELPAVAPVDDLTGVHVDAAHFGGSAP